MYDHTGKLIKERESPRFSNAMSSQSSIRRRSPSPNGMGEPQNNVENVPRQIERRSRQGQGRLRRQGIYWLLTIPHQHFTPYPMPGTTWAKGQLELSESGYLHWQIFIAFDSKKSSAQVQRMLGQECHCELSRSEAAEEYVWKDDTCVRGTRFELKILF